MAISQKELITEIEEHIRKAGGELGEWCVGTAKDCHSPFFRRRQAADVGDSLAYREAFTTNAAEEVVSYLVNARGIELDRDSAPEPGRIVFVHRKMRHVQ